MVPLSLWQILRRRIQPHRPSNMCEYRLIRWQRNIPSPHPVLSLHSLVRPRSFTLFVILDPHRRPQHMCQVHRDTRRRPSSRNFISRRQAHQIRQDCPLPYTLSPSTRLRPYHLPPLHMICITDARRQARKICQVEDPDRISDTRR